jgi:phospholipid-binding lipoprotein MlaA
VLIVVAAVAAAGCATSTPSKPRPQVAPPREADFSGTPGFDELEEELARRQVSVPDPLEPVNRVMYGVNDVVYVHVAKPVLEVYAGVVPKPVRLGIGNFFHNAATPPRLVNCLLQGKGPEAGTELQRLAINTTAGVLGFGDPARDRYGLRPAREDLGQTLAVYGMDDGLYVVLPLLGPSTLRDSLGRMGDQFLNPVRYVEPDELSIGLSAVRGVNGGSLHLGEYEALKAAAVDPYVAMREAYIQYRWKLIQDEGGPADPNRGGPQPR